MSKRVHVVLTVGEAETLWTLADLAGENDDLRLSGWRPYRIIQGRNAMSKLSRAINEARQP